MERPEPLLNAPDDVHVKVIRVGVCGTDCAEARGGRALAPDGSKQLMILSALNHNDPDEIKVVLE